jgi:ABC-2 type transport system ATP-binding protein
MIEPTCDGSSIASERTWEVTVQTNVRRDGAPLNTDGVVIRTEGLTKLYDTGVKAVDHLDLDVHEGEIFGLLGPNGAGKTTTVGMLTTRVIPTEGRATVAEVDVVAHPSEAKALMGVVSQTNTLDRSLTVWENLYFHGRYFGMGKKESRRVATQMLEVFRLADRADADVSTLSGGMAQRLMVARSIVHRPRTLFLDEPTSGLDPASRLDMWSAIRELVDDGTTVVLTTQYLDEADRLADQIVLIDGGRVAARGTAAELKRTVGGSRLEFTFPSADAFALGRDLLAPGTADADALAVSVPSDGSADDLRRLLRALDGVPLATVSENSPTLDDVFLTLTGHRASAEQRTLQEVSA